MKFQIIDRNGNPLTDLDGKLIVLASEAEARSWLRPGEEAERLPEPGEGNEASQF